MNCLLLVQITGLAYVGHISAGPRVCITIKLMAVAVMFIFLQYSVGVHKYDRNGYKRRERILIITDQVSAKSAGDVGVVFCLLPSSKLFI